jgi:hypothetical protein
VNWEKLKKNVGLRVQLAPPAIHLDALGWELPVRNEDWIIQQVTESDLRLDESVVIGLTTRMAKDAVYEFAHNAQRSVFGGQQYAFLTLKLQMIIQSNVITYRPCRPGERVAPPPPTIQEKCVVNRASASRRGLSILGIRQSCQISSCVRSASNPGTIRVAAS